VTVTLHRIFDRNVLRIERHLKHSPEKVWRAITDPAELKNWFPAEVEYELRTDAKMAFTFPGDAMPPSAGVVLELNPPQVFAFDWGGELLRFELTAEDSGCQLVFTHTFDDRPKAASFATGWRTCLDALEVALGESHAATAWSPAVHEAYVLEFGLDHGTTSDDGVQFERVLPWPEEKVRAELDSSGREYVSEFGKVHWELTPDPTGCRLTLTHTCPTDQRAASLAAWRTRIETLAQRLGRAS
jgi:uncharacterized protein YndB with AHSA1/START domain